MRSKYPKKCPRCNSTRLSKNEAYGMRCNRCGFTVKRKVDKEDISFKQYGGNQHGSEE